MSKTAIKLITILNDQKEWIENNPDFNLSGFVQEALDIIIEKRIPTKKILKENLNK
jgi:hypothetical protein